MSPQELAAIVARDADIHPSAWDSLDMIERVGGDIGVGNQAARDRRALLALLHEAEDQIGRLERQLQRCEEGPWG